MKKKLFAFSLLIIISANFSCHSTKKTTNKNSITKANTEAIKSSTKTVSPIVEPVFGRIGPAAAVYKTKNDYSNLVPILLSDDGNTIVSYPAPTDLIINGKLVLPTKLSKGYLLDNRGINAHSAFLSITYEDYSKLQQPPSMAEMLSKIADKHPFIEFYNCGLRSAYGQNLVENINALIENDGLKKCNCLTK